MEEYVSQPSAAGLHGVEAQLSVAWAEDCGLGRRGATGGKRGSGGGDPAAAVWTRERSTGDAR